MTQTTVIRINPRELAARMMEKMREEGTEFRKCCNCGDVYPLGTPTDEPGKYWNDETVCGERCFDAYLAYINKPDEY